MDKIIQLDGPSSQCPLLATCMIPHYTFLVKIAQFISLLQAPVSYGGILFILAIESPVGIRKITVTLQKIANNAVLDAGCLMSIIDYILFGKSQYLVRGQRWAKFLIWGLCCPCPFASSLIFIKTVFSIFHSLF